MLVIKDNMRTWGNTAGYLCSDPVLDNKGVEEPNKSPDLNPLTMNTLVQLKVLQKEIVRKLLVLANSVSNISKNVMAYVYMKFFFFDKDILLFESCSIRSSRKRGLKVEVVGRPKSGR